MALNTLKTDASGLSVGQPTKFYHQTMLDYAKPMLVHAQFAEKVKMPKHVGKTIQFRRWIPLSTITTPLMEASIPDGQTVTEEEITATVYQYGGYVAISDMLDLTHIDARPTEMSELMGDQGGRTIDEVVRDVMAATTNIHYCGSKTAIYDLKTTDEFNVTELRKVVRNLEEENTPYYRKGGTEHYIAIIDQYTKFDLQSDTNWINVKSYTDPKDIYSGEIGSLYGVRFVRTTLAKTYANSTLIAGQTYLTVASLSSATVTVDEAISTAEASALVDRYVNCIDVTDGTTYERQKITAAAAGVAGAATVTLDAAPAGFTLADGDTMWANEYGWNGNTVHATLIFGAKSYAMVDISENSGNMKILIKNKGSAGTADPLDQYSTIGWKVEALACTILNTNWIVKCLAGVTA